MRTEDPAIETYCLNQSSAPSKVCADIFDFTVKNIPHSEMLIGPMVGATLGFLVELISAKRILEIGCFTGYSALAMAERLPDDGEIITLDINPETTKVGEGFWSKSPDGKKIKLILGPALQTMQTLEGPFDLILIDADKENYKNYFDKSLELLSPRGIVVLDNCLWDGKVITPQETSIETVSLRNVAQYIKSRTDLTSVLLPIRDGLMIVQRKN